MPITNKIIGKRLQDARNNIGLSQEEASAQVGVSRVVLAQIEAGVRGVSSLEIMKLARLYSRSVGSLLAEEDETDNEEAVLQTLFRMSGGVLEDASLRNSLAHYLTVFKEAVALERLSGEPRRQLPPNYTLPEPQNNSDAYDQGQELARQERLRIGIGTGPIADLPHLINAQRVWALAEPMPEAVSGICLSHPSIGAAIMVNSKQAYGRRRFSYAHEYAHVLADRKRSPNSVSSIGNTRELVERRANSFASEFLMPSAAVHALLDRLDKGGPSREQNWVYDSATAEGEMFERRNVPGSQDIGYQDVAYIALEFNVSYAAAAYRLSDIGKINREKLNMLLEQANHGRKLAELLRLKDPDAEPDTVGQDFQPYLGAYIARLALEAYRREAISGGRLREACNLAGLDGNAILDVARERFGN
jgi:Zn-dependent peptidase ImmA (M78 family)/DNA-binding XRE family transcriptional regulator